ncbi:hypothetical protein L6452_00178 [Arctium lappa]|uniref:Uncharacterized protein n=1 Tax=Arctium lappa TaxID=4217 RepID=A0ACB9FD48_ARCLA|nr:hypothetical protein L6452_00178 [Arctium lappa]
MCLNESICCRFFLVIPVSLFKYPIDRKVNVKSMRQKKTVLQIGEERSSSDSKTPQSPFSHQDNCFETVEVYSR